MPSSLKIKYSQFKCYHDLDKGFVHIYFADAKDMLTYILTDTKTKVAERSWEIICLLSNENRKRNQV